MGLVAEIIRGASYPLLLVRRPSPVLVRVMAGSEHYWWYGNDSFSIFPIGPVDDSKMALDEIRRRLWSGSRP